MLNLNNSHVAFSESDYSIIIIIRPQPNLADSNGSIRSHWYLLIDAGCTLRLLRLEYKLLVTGPPKDMWAGGNITLYRIVLDVRRHVREYEGIFVQERIESEDTRIA
jgi:hypothetical protein